MHFEAYAFYRVVAYHAEMADFGFASTVFPSADNVTQGRLQEPEESAPPALVVPCDDVAHHHGSCDVCFMVVVWV